MIQVHPTAFIDPKDFHNHVKFLAPEALRGVGGLLLNLEGKRFINELKTRDVVSKGIYEQPNHVAFLLLSKDSAMKFGLSALKFYKFKGFIKEVQIHDRTDLSPMREAFESLLNQGSELTLPDTFVDNIQQVLVEYEEGAKQKKDTFGKVVFPQAESYFIDNIYTSDVKGEDYQECSFAVMLITPAIHYTMGGIEIDKDARVVSRENSSGYIPNLYAIGEVSGGLHGNNRLGGNS
uniref:Osmotic growth protein 1 n=1 Tax=Lygus hesperus TaxID=30085 RepID=A0A0A9YAS5_LYGHE